ncbi:MAG TPA: HAD-IIB family hydrolase [Pirellulaceae bacterium]|nr:HAD-IIB family hydrolase [Pirellulaceae bacterium]
MNRKRFILATDLDGTFLGGSEADRRDLYSWISAHRSDVGLIFVTGRDPQFIESLCGDFVPWPDFVVGDVGTTIAEVIEDTSNGATQRIVRPIKPLEADIAARWKDASAQIRALLDAAPGLTLQDTPFRYRVSYHYDASSYDPDAERKVLEIGYDVLISDNRYFDVLPMGVSKGPSLRRLLAHIGVPDERVLVAGDTLNDLTLFETGLAGVAVSNSEPALVQRLATSSRIFHASKPGAAGIAEAIQHFSFHPFTGVNV